MQPLVVRPERYRQLGPGEGCEFALVTNERSKDWFAIEAPSYRSHRILTFATVDEFASLLSAEISEPAHVLVISPDCFYLSPPPEKIGPRRKLLAMACNSTPTPPEAIAHFLDAMERTDPSRQEATAERFFRHAEDSPHLEIIDEGCGTRALFHHHDDSYSWNLQAGPLDWGGQQVAPAGVITILPVKMFTYDPTLRIDVDGEIAIRGLPILHSGIKSQLLDDQAALFDRLATLRDHAVIATVEHGVIARVRPFDADAEPAAAALESMFAADPRYRIIWEVGFAINHDFELFDGNVAMNELYGAADGVLRWGIGLIPDTPYAPIFLCPGSRVSTSDGTLLIGPAAGSSPTKRPRMNRRKVVGCPCQLFASYCAPAQEAAAGGQG